MIPIPARDSMMWQMQAYVDAVRDRVQRMRTMAGAESDLVLDAGGSLMPGDAAFIATALERNHLMWFEEPTNVHTSDGLGKISAESVMPVGDRSQYSRHRRLPEPAALRMHRRIASFSRVEQSGQDQAHGGARGDSLCGDCAIS